MQGSQGRCQAPYHNYMWHFRLTASPQMVNFRLGRRHSCAKPKSEAETFAAAAASYGCLANMYGDIHWIVDGMPS
jgi:hypothetical protein